MKTHIIAVVALIASLCSAQAQELPPLPGASANYARQFLAYQDQCRAEAEKKISDARAKLAQLLTTEANKASAADAVSIRSYLSRVQADAREAEAPTCFSYWTQTGRVIAGYYNNNPSVSVNVDIAGKKRTLTVTGNQDTAKTIGEVFLVREGRETKIGDWKTGQANPLTFDVSKQITKPGSYVFKFRYKDGGDEFTADKVGIEITK